ncbi:MAG: hypothetical protein QOG83_2455, partial [Alphaproteobacteria bacterium]|nr:hypothetical protein [Alphaproteobacteria bacterium]
MVDVAERPVVEEADASRRRQ